MASDTGWSEPQQYLIERLLWAYVKTGDWPVYQWLEAELWRRGESALELIESLPTSGGAWARGRVYRDVRVENGGIPRPEERVSLSIRALAKLPNGVQIVQLFIAALQLAAETRNSAVFDPTKAVVVQLTDVALGERLRGAAHVGFLKEIYGLLRTEPVDGFQSSGMSPDGSWFYELGPEVTKYVDVTVASYLAMVDAELARPPDPPAERVLSSPLDLATAFTYLDTTWRLHRAKSLLNVEDLAAMTSLAFPAASGDEFTARCSALGDVLKSLQAPSAPGVSGHAIRRLNAYLETNLGEEDRVELDDTMETLDRVRRARNARAHAAALADGQLALEEFGVPGPPFDWSAAWQTIQSATANALMDLRSIVARLPRG